MRHPPEHKEPHLCASATTGVETVSHVQQGPLENALEEKECKTSCVCGENHDLCAVAVLRLQRAGRDEWPCCRPQEVGRSGMKRNRFVFLGLSCFERIKPLTKYAGRGTEAEKKHARRVLRDGRRAVSTLPRLLCKKHMFGIEQGTTYSYLRGGKYISTRWAYPWTVSSAPQLSRVCFPSRTSFGR